MRKLTLSLLATLLIFSVFGVAVYAEEPVSESVPSEFFTEYTVSIKYTDDSTCKSGVLYETYSDSILNEAGFKLVADLPIGHVIYDDPETSYIDGIRINGSTVETLKVPVDGTGVTEYVVNVRTVYTEGVLGDIARMSDGTYDWTKLLENPVMVFQLAYWALAILTVVAGLITSVLGKKKKVKTADEIASSVDAVAKEALSKIEHKVTDTVITEFTPVFDTILKGLENVVKAVTLSTSNSKEAPSALLDVLKESATTDDVNALIDNIRKAVESKAEESAISHAENAAILHAIAHSEDVSEEVHDDVKPVF